MEKLHLVKDPNDLEFFDTTETKLGGAIVQYRFRAEEAERKTRSLFDLMLGIADIFKGNIKLNKHIKQQQKHIDNLERDHEKKIKLLNRQIKRRDRKIDWLENWRSRRRAQFAKWLKKRLKLKNKILKKQRRMR